MLRLFKWSANVQITPVVFAIIVMAMVSACVPKFTTQKTNFDPQRCLEEIPQKVDGLKILQGPRTPKSIIRDMVPAICNGRVLFKQKKLQDPSLNPGIAVFRVVVEYTGEVNSVAIDQTTIQSNLFLRKLSDIIMDLDFIGWAPNDVDTIFLYPVQFDE